MKRLRCVIKQERTKAERKCGSYQWEEKAWQGLSDILAKSKRQRNWKAGDYMVLWMGAPGPDQI